jgi:hypothetical protein
MSSATCKTASKPMRRVKHDRSVPTNVSKATTRTPLAENEKAIDHYNSFVEKHGLFGGS